MKPQHLLLCSALVTVHFVSAETGTTTPPPVPEPVIFRPDTRIDWGEYYCLRELCMQGDLPALQAKLSDGANKDVALFCAAQSHRTELVTALLQAGANVNSAPIQMCTPLYAAIGNKKLGECEGWAAVAAETKAYRGQAELVQLLLQAGANPNTCSSCDCIPPIVEAARSGDIATVEALLKSGADINSRDASGASALHWAIAHGRNNVVQYLLEHNAMTEVPTTRTNVCMVKCYDELDIKAGSTPLHIAAATANEIVVQQLLQAGAHVNTEDANGDTPFTAAAKCANVPIMQLLRQAGADINKTNKQGNNAFDSLNYRAQAQQVLLAIHYLTEIGVKPAATNPLTCASRGQNQSALRLLVEKGYRISPTDHSTEDSALTELIQPHRQAELTEEQIIACIDLLVQAGADVPAMGHTLLKHSICVGYEKVFTHLMKLGAPLRDPHNNTVTDLTKDTPFVRHPQGRLNILNSLKQNYPDIIEEERRNREIQSREAAIRAANSKLINAAFRGERDGVVQALQQGADVNYIDNFGRTALEQTLSFPQVKTAELLLQLGADPNLADKDGRLLIQKCKNTEILSLLVRYGAHINKQDKKGETCLHSVAAVNSELTACALSAGADPTIRDNNGCTALMKVRKTDPALFLLQAAPQTLLYADNSGNTALHHIAAKCGYCDNLTPAATDTLPTPETEAKICRNITGEVHGAEITHLLLKAGIDADSTNHLGQTALHLAAGQGNLPVVALLLSKGANARLIDKSGRSALSYAQQTGNKALEDLLRRHGAPDGPETAFLSAAVSGNTQEIDWLVQQGIDMTNEKGLGIEALCVAVLNGHADTAKYLILAGVDINGTGKSGRRILNIAVEQNNENAVRLAVQLGAKLKDGTHLPAEFDFRCRYGTALDEAAYRGNFGMVQLLAQLGCPIDHYTPTTAFAVFGGNTEIIRWLAANGAKTDASTRAGIDSPLCLAVDTQNTECIKLLLELGASTSGSNYSGPLSNAIRTCNAEHVRILLEAGADADSKDRYNQSLLHSAVCNNPPEVIELLIKHGADVNRRCNVNGRHTTPLINACRYRKEESPEIIHLLLRAGADPTIRDAAGKTALDYAQEKGFLQSAEILKQHTSSPHSTEM